MAASGVAGRGVGDLCICWGGGFDWQLPGELLRASGYCCVSGEDRGSICFDVLGRGDGGAVYRLGGAEESGDEQRVGGRGAGGFRGGRGLGTYALGHGDVGESCAW